MKWIGQNIYDLVSRFRSDVYLEDISSGTIASGGNLGLDSNNKIVKATEASGDITGVTAGTGLSGGGTSGAVTLNVDASQTQITGVGTITTGVWNGTAIASAYLDSDTAHLTTDQTFSGRKTFSAATTFSGATTTFTSATADSPLIRVLNTTDDDQAGRLMFDKLRDDDAVATGQNLGEIWFTGQDNAQNTEDYAYIVGKIDVGTGGQESGKLQFGVAAHDGSTRNAMTLTGGSEAAEVDATIGLGANSVVTIPGNIDLAGDIDVDGTLETDALTIGGTNILTGSLVTTLGTISAGVWNGTAIASAYLDADTAHLSGTQTFTGAKTFTDTVALTGTGQITGIDTVSADTDAASKAYVDRPAKQIQIYHANWKGNAGTGLTYIPLAGVPDEAVGSGSSVGSKESNAIIMPAAGKIKEIILRQHWTSTITTSDDITWTVYNRASNKKMNAFTAIGSTFDMVNPTQAGTDANNTRTSGEISYAFNEYDAVAISMQWASTGPTNSSDRHFVTVVVEYDFSGIGY